MNLLIWAKEREKETTKIRRVSLNFKNSKISLQKPRQTQLGRAKAYSMILSKNINALISCDTLHAQTIYLKEHHYIYLVKNVINVLV